jgi:phage minor structural protein
MNTVLPSRIFGNKFLFDGAAQELGFIPVEVAVKTASGSSEASVNVIVEGIGIKIVQGGADAAINIMVDGAGQVVVDEVVGGSEAQIIILVEAAGMKLARALPDVEADVLIGAEGSGQRIVEVKEGSSEAGVVITVESAGQKLAASGSEAITKISPDGTGVKLASSDGESTVIIIAEGNGVRVIPFTEGSSEATIIITCEGTGIKIAQPPAWYTLLGYVPPILVDSHLRPVALLHQAHEISVHETLAGEDKLTFNLPHSAPAELTAGALLDLAGKIYRTMILGNKDDQGTRIIDVEAWALWYDLAKMPELPAHEWIGATVLEILAWLLPGSGWTAGTVTVTARRNLRWSGGVNRLECLREMERVFNAEIVWDTASRTVSVVMGGGEDTGEFFLRGRNLRKFEVETDIRDTAYRLYPRGRKGLTISTVNNGIQYLEVPSPFDPPPSAVLVAEEFTDPQQLKEYAEVVFATMNTPRKNYRCKVADLSGIDPTVQRPKVGDIVTVYDETTDIQVRTRVVGLVWKTDQPEDTGIELSTTSLDMAELANRLRDYVELRRQHGGAVIDNYGLNIIADNENLFFDEHGLNPDFIKRFPNKIINSGFEWVDETTQKPVCWEGDGKVTDWANWEGSYALELKPDEYMEQGVLTDTTHAGADPAWWEDIQTRVSFKQKGSAVRVWVKRVSDGTPYELTDNSGEVPVSGSYLDYGASATWPDGHRTFYFLPVPGAGRVKVGFQNIDISGSVYLDAVQIEPDFTGKWPSFYTPGPRSIPMGDLLESDRGLAYYIDGTLALGLKASLKAPVALRIKGVLLEVDTAPTDADLIIDVNRNDITMYTTQANRPRIIAGSKTGSGIRPDVATVAKGNKITVEIDQIGSTVAGGNLSVTVVCEVG